MRESTPQTIYLRDYTPPPYLIDRVDLYVDLHEDHTDVTATLQMRANPQGQGGPLVLDGEALETLAVMLDGRELDESDYHVEAGRLTIDSVPEAFELKTVVRIHPESNTSLEGLYRSGSGFFTQCEAEGFRRITWFVDRPDVLARYTTTIEADRERYPVLLSNGNPVASEALADDRHRASWEDPFPKPSYLFAMVAGDLARVEDSFTTASGRAIPLHMYVARGDEAKCGHALDSLRKSMRWDEQVWGLEYDLDLFMIVAVGDFNMGAMENKGLNIFNSVCVLARPETATDTDYQSILAVVGHEYFHNWTGNRVTCRDWFQLSLKEGLTVFREHQFAADMGSAAVQRIGEVAILRSGQFPEDAGPLAHPVRPDAYMDISNFYTATVYLKGSEVIRMLHTLLGEDAFMRGARLYLERNDGRAATVEDWVAALAEASGRDLSAFARWYSQAGTPELTVERQHDAASGRYILEMRQQTPPTPGQPEKQPVPIPVRLALLDAEGRALPLRLVGEDTAPATERVLEFEAEHQRFEFEDIPAGAVPSLLRGFSAPVRLDAGYSEEELLFLMAFDDDAFGRWEAAQTLLSRAILSSDAGHSGVSEALLGAFRRTLEDEQADPALVAEALRLPAYDYLAGQVDEVDAGALVAARESVRAALAGALEASLIKVYERSRVTDTWAFEPQQCGRRALANLCLWYLNSLGADQAMARCQAHYADADNMTDTLAALGLMAETGGTEADRHLADFYAQWQGDALVVDKWFSVQATAPRDDALERVRELMAHPAFTLRNPNRVRALIGAFCRGNPRHFHAADGSGHALLADVVLELAPINSQIAARLLTLMNDWRRHEPVRREHMQRQLHRIVSTPGLPTDVYEVASKAVEAR